MRFGYLRTSTFTMVMSLFVFSQCNQDESGLLGDSNSYKEIKPANGIVNQGEVIEVSLKGFDLKESNYTGKFEKNEVALNKLNDSTLVVVVPVSALGKSKLEVEALKFFANYDVKETVLTGTVNETIDNLNNSFELVASGLPADESTAFLQALDVYNQALSQATDQQKKELAIFYEANKEIIEVLLNGSDKGNTGGRNFKTNDFWNDICDPAWTKELCEFKRSVFVLGAGVVTVVAGVGTGNAVVAVAGVVVAVKGFTDAKKNWKTFCDSELSVVSLVVGNDLNGGRTQSTVKFFKDAPSYLPIRFTMRSVNSSDKSNLVSGYITFFESVSIFEGYVIKINNAIDWVNDKIPFSNISHLQIDPLSSQSASKETPLTKEAYDKMAISIVNNTFNITIKEKSLSGDGRVVLTLTSDKEYKDPVDISLKFSLTDLFNNFQQINGYQFMSVPDSTEIYRTSALGKYTIVDYPDYQKSYPHITKIDCELTQSEAIYTTYWDSSNGRGYTSKTQWEVKRNNNKYYVRTGMFNETNFNGPSLTYPVTTFTNIYKYVK